MNPATIVQAVADIEEQFFKVFDGERIRTPALGDVGDRRIRQEPGFDDLSRQQVCREVQLVSELDVRQIKAQSTAFLDITASFPICFQEAAIVAQVIVVVALRHRRMGTMGRQPPGEFGPPGERAKGIVFERDSGASMPWPEPPSVVGVRCRASAPSAVIPRASHDDKFTSPLPIPRAALRLAQLGAQEICPYGKFGYVWVLGAHRSTKRTLLVARQSVLLT